MLRIYLYKLTADSGGAPCVERGLLSLAICKPMIRCSAKCGDVIFGFAANSLRPNDNRLIYAARVTQTLSNGEYYKSSRYARRGDCIYRFRSGQCMWRRNAQHHGPDDLVHDLGDHPKYPRAIVLLSTDFRYFGRAASDVYKSKFPKVRDAVESLGRGLRVRHNPALRDQLLAMKKWVWRSTRNKMTGPPTSAPSRRTCHRGRSCMVV
jgi:hypothetical protein